MRGKSKNRALVGGWRDGVMVVMVMAVDDEEKQLDSRQDSAQTPLGGPQDCSIVSPPHSDRPLGVQSPVYDPAVGITRDQQGILAHEAHAVDLSDMATQDVLWLGRREKSGLGLNGCHGERGMCQRERDSVCLCVRTDAISAGRALLWASRDERDRRHGTRGPRDDAGGLEANQGVSKSSWRMHCHSPLFYILCS